MTRLAFGDNGVPIFIVKMIARGRVLFGLLKNKKRDSKMNPFKKTLYSWSRVRLVISFYGKY
jgi:hypothetical protein